MGVPACGNGVVCACDDTPHNRPKKGGRHLRAVGEVKKYTKRRGNSLPQSQNVTCNSPKRLRKGGDGASHIKLRPTGWPSVGIPQLRVGAVAGRINFRQLLGLFKGFVLAANFILIDFATEKNPLYNPSRCNQFVERKRGCRNRIQPPLQLGGDNRGGGQG